MKRREFVAGVSLLMATGMIAGGAMSGAAGSRAQPVGQAGNRAAKAENLSSKHLIDVHQHAIPGVYAAALGAHGVHSFAGRALPSWSVEQTLAAMDATGTRSALLSLPSPGVWLGQGEGAARLARQCNEEFAKLTQQQSTRLGFLAALPLPDTKRACAEAIYALDELGADGVALMASFDERFLGDADFTELMHELNRRQARVLVLPNLHASSAELHLDTPGFAVEQACDLSRAAVNLILSGTLERYPAIRWILAEGGGFLPYIAWRVSLANAMPSLQDLAPQGVMTYLQRFYFNTSMLALPALAVLGELVHPSRVLFGSGRPFSSGSAEQTWLAQAQQAGVWRGEEIAGIERGHALSLFPRFAAATETVVPAPLFESESTLQRIKRSAAQPLAALMQRFKD